MDIVETEAAWRAEFFPTATNTDQNDKWSERGFRVQYGIVDGETVPKYIDYDKTKITLDQAVEYAKNIRSCEHCKRINSTVDVVRNIKLKDNYKSSGGSSNELSQLRSEFSELKKELQKRDNSPTRKSATHELATSIAMDMFKTNFTTPGRIELALIFDDDSFIDDLLPEKPNEEDMLELRAQMSEFWAGDIGRYRNKDQLREYAKMQRDTIKALRGEPIDDEEEDKAKVIKKKHGNRTRVKVV
jgi:hypothetical protein